MASYRNYSQRDRAVKSSDLNNNPENVEARKKINQNQVRDFESLKPKWRELCSYFRLIKHL